MAIHSPATNLARPLAHQFISDEEKRCARWHYFQAAFALTCIGILGDIITSAIGFQQMGSGYEQNPLAKAIILDTGWLGLTFLLAAVCAVCYFSFRAVYARLSLRWSMIGNVLITVVGVVRWFVVSTAIIYMVFPIH